MSAIMGMGNGPWRASAAGHEEKNSQ